MAAVEISKVVFFIPPNLKRFKLDLFERIGGHIVHLGGKVLRYDFKAVEKLPDDLIPVVGCSPEFRDLYKRWAERNRQWIYWDRGYLRRHFHTWLPIGSAIGVPRGYYRWHRNVPQMDRIYDVPDDRWRFLKLTQEIKPWNKNGRHIIVADTMPGYWELFSDGEWTKRTAAYLKTVTKRDVVIRPKESKRPLQADLKDAHCLVAHGSIAAVESVVMGCPVFVDPMCAAALVGGTDFSKVETPVYPERMPWLHSLAYCQFSEDELCNGTLWRLIR